jgi:DNA ligase (NAD+)
MKKHKHIIPRKGETPLKALGRTLVHLSNLYENGDDCIHPDSGVIVTDEEYDDILKIFQKEDPNSDLLKKATPADTIADKDAGKIKHNPPMTSISKANGDDKEETLEKWLVNSLGDNWKNKKSKIVKAFKRDGVAVAIYYKKGKLVGAGLRPRGGMEGEDVTENIKYVKGVPIKLPKPVTISIRGELECQISTFEKVNKQFGNKYANPRNFTAGSIRQFKDPTKTRERKLNFVAYAIEWQGSGNPPYKTEYERALWCAKTLKIPHIRVEPLDHSSLPKILKQLKELEDLVPEIDYEVDGVVLSVSNLEDAAQLGRHGDRDTGNPHAKLAWKFKEQSAVVTVKDIDWPIGRTGALTPRVHFNPVQLAGTSVEKATCHNLGYILRRRITIGTKIRVIKSGKIIPYVVDVVAKAGKVNYPKKCPSCNNPLDIVEGNDDNQELVCSNLLCEAQAVRGLYYYLSTFGVKGVGESTVEKLYESGVVKTPVDFYKLRVKDVVKSGLSKRQSLLALAGIYMIPKPEKQKDDKKLGQQIEKKASKQLTLPMAKLIAAFGIPSVGVSTGDDLVDHFGKLDKIRKASVANLEEVGNIGEKTAQRIKRFFSKNSKLVDDLLEHIKPEGPKTGKLSGKTFVFTGGLPGGKDVWKQRVKDQGGKVSSSVSEKTDYVVIGNDPGSKADKAADLEIDTLDSKKLEKLLA